MVRLTDRPAMTIAVDLGRKATKTNKMAPIFSFVDMFIVKEYETGTTVYGYRYHRYQQRGL